MDASNLVLSAAVKCFVTHLLDASNGHMTEGPNAFSTPSMQDLPY